MLRLPPYTYHRPGNLADALDLMGTHGSGAMLIAGGTDLVPNLKHRLFEPDHLVALGQVQELVGIRVDGGVLDIGAGETLTAVARDPLVRAHAPALAEAAAHVAGPQLRNRATLGGNVCLDTRCTYYNQTEFWRQALGYCLKKDGDVCHVTRVGKKCVAAHSADTPPVLIAMDATASLSGPEGERDIALSDWFVADGIWNSVRKPDEVLTRIRIPIRPENVTSYAKLRQRGSIDFPLLTVAITAALGPDHTVRSLTGVVTALGSRPKVLSGWSTLAEGQTLNADVIDALAERAYKQCTPLENIIVDPVWRKAMVPVQVRRALETLVEPA